MQNIQGYFQHCVIVTPAHQHVSKGFHTVIITPSLHLRGLNQENSGEPVKRGIVMCRKRRGVHQGVKKRDGCKMLHINRQMGPWTEKAAWPVNLGVYVSFPPFTAL